MPSDQPTAKELLDDMDKQIASHQWNALSKFAAQLSTQRLGQIAIESRVIDLVQSVDSLTNKIEEMKRELNGPSKPF